MGGGINTAATPSELQYKIANLIGPVFTAGIPDTERCDTTGASIRSFNHAPLPIQIQQKSYSVNNLENLDTCCSAAMVQPSVSHVSLCTPSPDTPPAKKPKTSNRELQNEEMIEVEQKIQSAIPDLQDELRQTNHILNQVHR